MQKVEAFTPGPWIAEYDAVWGAALITTREGFIATAERGPHCEANASIIAAAPDLYEALARCHAVFIGDDTETPIAQLVDAALARARGETQ